jgi:hypothetical protein
VYFVLRARCDKKVGRCLCAFFVRHGGRLYDFLKLLLCFCQTDFLGDWQGGGYDQVIQGESSKTEKCHVTSN